MELPFIDMARPRACIVRVLVSCPDRKAIFIEKPGKKGDPFFLQFPGGGSEPEDKNDIRKTARRELGQETGIWISETELDRFELIYSNTKAFQPWFCLSISISQAELERYIPETSEGKVVRHFPLDVLAGTKYPLSDRQYGILKKNHYEKAESA